MVAKKIAGYSGLRAVALAASLGMHAGLAGALCIVAWVGGRPEEPPAPDYGDRLRPVQIVFVPREHPAPPQQRPQPPEPPPLAPARTPAPQPPDTPVPDAPSEAVAGAAADAGTLEPAADLSRRSPKAKPDSASDENSPPAASRPPQAAPSPAPETPPAQIPVPGGAAPPRKRGLPSAEIVSLPVPEYPPRSRRLGEEGLVLLEVEVLPGGEVGEVRVLQAPGYPRLVAAAIEAVRKARFRPALSNGLPVRSLVEIPIRFRLD